VIRLSLGGGRPGRSSPSAIHGSSVHRPHPPQPVGLVQPVDQTSDSGMSILAPVLHGKRVSTMRLEQMTWSSCSTSFRRRHAQTRDEFLTLTLESVQKMVRACRRGQRDRSERGPVRVLAQSFVVPYAGEHCPNLLELGEEHPLIRHLQITGDGSAGESATSTHERSSMRRGCTKSCTSP